MQTALLLDTFPEPTTSASSVPEPILGSDDADVALMLQSATGDQAAFGALVEKYQKPLLNFFVRMGAYTDSEDLVQDTFIRLYRYRNRYQPKAKFTTFLYVLARRVWADLGRKSLRRERLAGSLQTEAATLQQTEPSARLSSVDIEAALGTLSQKLREVIVLNIYQGLRYQDIAEVLGIPLGTVKSRINLAITALREIFQKDELNLSNHQ